MTALREHVLLFLYVLLYMTTAFSHTQATQKQHRCATPKIELKHPWKVSHQVPRTQLGSPAAAQAARSHRCQANPFEPWSPRSPHPRARSQRTPRSAATSPLRSPAPRADPVAARTMHNLGINVECRVCISGTSPPRSPAPRAGPAAAHRLASTCIRDLKYADFGMLEQIHPCWQARTCCLHFPWLIFCPLLAPMKEFSMLRLP